MTRLMASVASARDVEAFEALFRHYGPRVRAFMLRQTRDISLAEELMQETMMTVWNKADLFYPERGTVDAWVFTVARNLRTSAFRKMKRPVFDPTDPAFVPDEPLEPGEQLERTDDAERLRLAMKDLPPEQLEVLKYAFFDDISHRKLAAKLGLPVGTIKSRIRMAFGKLRKALEDAE
ncbi:RNA polymerase sigma factor [Rhizobium halophytocola]|uniref:RNA polymerase sigma-70 factor (ECF subfamily) n=1 Tax=Rhizobium halophytocola TaxID=735519 RepID=A0ABS4DTQ0_9HYPH|nr:sigma-70 family RNA polymerase sigma factor [Rhizobium halophytocola]MBP1849074.1 RNA polymerase sigma-70 factor (ECF subfamily) [Rhizobium halophytocola]